MFCAQLTNVQTAAVTQIFGNFPNHFVKISAFNYLVADDLKFVRSFLGDLMGHLLDYLDTDVQTLRYFF